VSQCHWSEPPAPPREPNGYTLLERVGCTIALFIVAGAALYALRMCLAS